MGLAEALKAHAPSRSACRMHSIMDRLDGPDLEALEAALANPKVSGAVIANALRDEGHSIAESTLTAWRRKGCACAG